MHKPKFKKGDLVKLIEEKRLHRKIEKIDIIKKGTVGIIEGIKKCSRNCRKPDCSHKYSLKIKNVVYPPQCCIRKDYFFKKINQNLKQLHKVQELIKKKLKEME